MELRHLRYFVAVADEMHFTRAAIRLGIAQPPLTQQIKALERELGASLFARAGRGIALTAAGQAFLVDAKSILAHVEGAARKAKDAALGLEGTLEVGFTESASFHPLVTEAFKAFQARFLNVELKLREAPTTTLAAALEVGELDLAFVRPPYPRCGNVQFDFLAKEDMVAAVPADHPLAGEAALDLRALSGERFILYPRAIRPGLSDEIVQACRAADFEPITVQEAPQLSSTINLVAAGMGISIVPEGLKKIRPQDVRFIPIRDFPVFARLELGRVMHGLSPLAANFIDTVKSCIARAGA